MARKRRNFLGAVEDPKCPPLKTSKFRTCTCINTRIGQTSSNATHANTTSNIAFPFSWFFDGRVA